VTRLNENNDTTVKDAKYLNTSKTEIMKRSVKSLIGFAIGATDGEIGKVKEFYFDDRTWNIRYLVAETGSWLSGRKVLISPGSLLMPDWESKVFSVNLTQEQVKNSPDIDTDKPVSRQQERDLSKYYPRTGFWAGGLWAGGVGTTGMIMPVQESIEEAILNEEDNDPHLRSTDKVTGYSIKATDGDIGDVEDFIIDESTLIINYMVVDTGNWFPGKKVIISPKWIKEIKWDTSEVVVNATVDQVKNSPEYDVSKYVDEVYERSLTNYYGRFIS
jgi:uncharacterized protein YrrD